MTHNNLTEAIEEDIKTQVLTDVEWYETKNRGLFLRPVYVNRPPNAFPVICNPNTRERTVITSHFKTGWRLQVPIKSKITTP